MPLVLSSILFFKLKRTYEHILAIVTGLATLSWFANQQVLLLTAILIGVASLVSPFVAQGIARVWLAFAALLGRVVPGMLLLVIFFALLFPIALLARMGGKDPLLLKKPVGTAFRDCKKSFLPGDFEKTW